MPSPGLLRTVCAYLDQRRLIATELYVIPPTYVPVTITLQVLAQPDADTAAVEQAGEVGADQFLDPLAGGSVDPATPGTGWPFGGTIYFVDVLRVASQVADVVRVADLVITLNGVTGAGLHGRRDSSRRAAHRAIRRGDGDHRSRRHGGGRMTNTAPFRNPPPGPPDDPTWMILRGRDGWPVAAVDRPRRVAARLRAGAQEPARRPCALADPSGRFGGLTPPPNVALAPDGTVVAPRYRARQAAPLRRLRLRFVDVPCTGGIGHGARQLVTPVALAARGRDILVLDGGADPAPGRVLAFASHGFALRAVWLPPKGAVAQPWQPSAIAVAPDGRPSSPTSPTARCMCSIAAAHGARPGSASAPSPRWRSTASGASILMSPAKRRFASRMRAAKEIAEAASVDEVRDCFAPLPNIASDAAGRINLAGRCAGAGWFDAAGEPSAATPATPPAFAASGVWLSTALDSRIGRCQWHRVVLNARLPRGTTLTLQTYTSEVEQPIDLIAALPPTSWVTVPIGAKPAEALILSPPGRFLWLRATLAGNQQATPRIEELRIEYPRISLRRYLPAAFAPDPVSADFSDRLLGIFDRGFRSVETQIDSQADLFDPRSAPADPKSPGCRTC